MSRSAIQWGLTKQQALLLAAIPILIVLAGAAAVPFFNLFVFLTAEDSVIEWVQFGLLGTASLLFLWAGIASLRRGQALGFLLLLAAVGAFFVAGEEISWGQRLFGWQTPGELAAINNQHETTVHNISWAHQAFIYAVMLVGMYGSMLPLGLLAAGRSGGGRWAGLLVPPLCLAPAFFMAFGYRLARLLPLELWFPRLAFPITKFSEVTELCLYFGLAAFGWLQVRRVNEEKASGDSRKELDLS